MLECDYNSIEIVEEIYDTQTTRLQRGVHFIKDSLHVTNLFLNSPDKLPHYARSKICPSIIHYLQTESCLL